jgi:predicted component of type VI protein secretion system
MGPVVDTMLLPDGQAIPLADGMLLGRSETCPARLPAPSVSREHAVVRRMGDRWSVEDLGSRNGTLVNDTRLTVGIPHVLRHGDRLVLGEVAVVLSMPEEVEDPDRTSSLELADIHRDNPLSAYQVQVVRRLAAPWLAGGDEPASNSMIAADLGTPLAVEAVKAALRRAYAKAGLADAPPHTKRRALCRIARQRNWI